MRFPFIFGMNNGHRPLIFLNRSRNVIIISQFFFCLNILSEDIVKNVEYILNYVRKAVNM